MLTKKKFFFLAGLLVFFSATDMIITEVGIEYFYLQELNPLIEYFRGISASFAVAIKIIVPLLVCVYLYYRLGFEKYFFNVFRWRLRIDVIALLLLFNAYYLLAIIINTTGIIFVIFYLGHGA